jgi:hypothetical protein
VAAVVAEVVAEAEAEAEAVVATTKQKVSAPDRLKRRVIASSRGYHLHGGIMSG